MGGHQSSQKLDIKKITKQSKIRGTDSWLPALLCFGGFFFSCQVGVKTIDTLRSDWDRVAGDRKTDIPFETFKTLMQVNAFSIFVQR